MESDRASAESLRQALERTLVSNPTIEAERAKVAAVEETLDIARSGYRPSLSVNGDLARQRVDTDPVGPGDTTNMHTPRGYTVNLNQPLYRGGRTIAALNRADASILAARESLRNVEQSTLLSVATTYVAVVRDLAISRLRQNDVRLLKEQLAATQDRLAAGVVTKTDVALARSRRSAAQSEEALARANLRTSRAEYVRLTGRSAGKLNYPPMSRKLPASNLAVAIKRGNNQNPAILAALYGEDVARFTLEEVKGERLPEFSVEASFDHHWEGSSALEEQRTANIRLRGRVPLYQGGSVLARIRQARATLRQRQLEVSAARTSIRSQIVSSWEIMAASKSRMKSARDQIKAARTALEGIRNEESVGQRTVLDVLDAEQELLDARVSLQQAQGDYIIAYFRLLAAMGRSPVNGGNGY